MIKGFVFDLDGVLVFTDHFHYLSWKAIADEEGIEFNEQINNQLRGVSRKDSLEIILRKASKTYTEDEKDALCEKKNNIYKTPSAECWVIPREVCELVYQWNFKEVCYALTNDLSYEMFLINHNE